MTDRHTMFTFKLYKKVKALGQMAVCDHEIFVFILVLVVTILASIIISIMLGDSIAGTSTPPGYWLAVFCLAMLWVSGVLASCSLGLAAQAGLKVIAASFPKEALLHEGLVIAKNLKNLVQMILAHPEKVQPDVEVYILNSLVNYIALLEDLDLVESASLKNAAVEVLAKAKYSINSPESLFSSQPKVIRLYASLSIQIIGVVVPLVVEFNEAYLITPKQVEFFIGEFENLSCVWLDIMDNHKVFESLK